MSSSLRRTGIDIVGEVPWDTHFCAFYHTKDELMSLVVQYIKNGLENNEACAWVVSDLISPKEALDALSVHFKDLEDRIRGGQLDILRAQDWYTPNGRFDAKQVLAAWKDKALKAKSNGFSGFRATGDTSWLHNELWDKFVEYESVIGHSVLGLEMLVLCTYSLDLWQAYQVVDVVSTHEFALLKVNGEWRQIENSERRKAVEDRLSVEERYRQEILELNRDLQERTALLASTNREMAAFSYSVSHDLQAPLRRIEGFSSLLQEELSGAVSGKAKDYLGRISRSVDDMNRLIEGMLRLSRLSRAEITWNSVDLSKLAASAVEKLRAMEPSREVEVRIQEGLSAKGDPVLLSSAIDNLVGNAWKYTSKQEHAKIEFGAETENGHQVFYVRDNGIGFDKSQKDRLFLPFQRLQKETEYSGLGIGLATVTRIVSRHKGRVWAEGEPGKGATFRFTLGGPGNGQLPGA